MLAGSLVAAIALWAWTWQDVRAQARHMAQHKAEVLGVELQGHLGEYAARAREAAMVAQVHHAPGGEALGQFLQSLSEREDFQGFYGLGVCLIARGPGGSERCLTTAVVSKEGGPHPLGLDHLSIPERAEAMAVARDTGRVALTAPLRLRVDPPGGAPGNVILYLPIYADLRLPDSLEARRASLRGYVFCPIPFTRFFQGIWDLRGDRTAVEIRDAASEMVVYRGPGWRVGSDRARALQVSSVLPIGGRVWRVSLQPTLAYFTQGYGRSPSHVLILGLLVSLLTFTVALSLEGARARAEQLAEDMAGEARENEARLREITETMGEGLYVVDREGVITFVNPEAGRLLGWEPQELLGRKAHDVFHRRTGGGLQVPVEDCGILRVAQTGAKYVSEEEVHWHREDRPLVVAVSARPVIRSGSPAGAVVIFRDITERKQMEWAMGQAHKLESLELMAGGIAHDFNNLFQGLLGNLELARMDVAEGSRAAVSLRRMDEILERAARLSGEMLLYSGRSHPHREILDLPILVGQATVGGKAQVHLDQGLPPLEGDPIQIGKLLSILLENAAEAGAGSPIRLAVRRVELQTRDLAEGYWPEPARPGPAVMIEVEDGGPGIPPEVMDRMFDPFYSTKALGRGLGLPAALGILRGHQGQIQVISSAGRGTRVRIYLPVHEAASAAAHAPTSGTPSD